MKRSGGFGGPGERTTHRLFGRPNDAPSEKDSDNVPRQGSDSDQHRTTYADLTSLGHTVNGLANSVN